jgi:hypothetical protein
MNDLNHNVLPSVEPIRQSPAVQAGPRVHPLAVTAMLLAVALVVRVGMLWGAGSPEPRALADMVTQSGAFQLMTTASQIDNELLYVLDSRTETLMAFGVNNLNSFQLVAREDLKAIFNNARGQAGGGRR